MIFHIQPAIDLVLRQRLYAQCHTDQLNGWYVL